MHSVSSLSASVCRGADITSGWRIVNRNDLVPCLPPAEIFDPFEFQILTCQHVLDWRPISFQTGDVIENHSLGMSHPGMDGAKAIGNCHPFREQDLPGGLTQGRPL